MAGLAAFLDAAFGELRNAHRGASAPDSPVEGQRWWDTSGGATAEVLKRYTVAGGWVSLLTVNITAGTITAIHGITDEDAMTSNSAVLPPSQQSVKAYVDTYSGALMEFNNLSFTATVSGKALTVALKGTDGNDPSATNPVKIPFRSATLTSGVITKRTVTSALSVVLSSGSTLGFGAAEAGRIYVWVIDNAGTVVLGLSRTADIFPESGVVSTTAEGGSGAADSASVMYSTAAQTNKACRCIGYIEITTGATAGEWDNAATKIQVMGPGVHRTGDIVQTQAQYLTSSGSTGNTIPVDNTIPQITEGAEVLSKAITPTNVINHLYFNAQVIVDDATQDLVGLALFEGETADAFAVAFSTIQANIPNILTLETKKAAPAVTSTTYTVRIGAGTTSIYWNRRAGGDVYGGVATSFLRITEVFA
jgi:hypothetical protein